MLPALPKSFQGIIFRFTLPVFRLPCISKHATKRYYYYFFKIINVSDYIAPPEVFLGFSQLIMKKKNYKSLKHKKPFVHPRQYLFTTFFELKGSMRARQANV